MFGSKTEGLAALCLIANNHRTKELIAERQRDGRIGSIAGVFERGRFVVRIFAGEADYYAKGESELSEDDARAQAETAFLAWEHQTTQRPGDLVRIGGAPCF